MGPGDVGHVHVDEVLTVRDPDRQPLNQRGTGQPGAPGSRSAYCGGWQPANVDVIGDVEALDSTAPAQARPWPVNHLAEPGSLVQPPGDRGPDVGDPQPPVTVEQPGTVEDRDHADIRWPSARLRHEAAQLRPGQPVHAGPVACRRITQPFRPPDDRQGADAPHVPDFRPQAARTPPRPPGYRTYLRAYRIIARSAGVSCRDLDWAPWVADGPLAMVRLRCLRLSWRAVRPRRTAGRTRT